MALWVVTHNLQRVLANIYPKSEPGSTSSPTKWTKTQQNYVFQRERENLGKCETISSQGILPKYWKNQGILTLENGANTGKFEFVSPKKWEP